jgi:hypothetical protein
MVHNRCIPRVENMILDELSIVASTQSPLPMGTIPKLVAQPTKLSKESPNSMRALVALIALLRNTSPTDDNGPGPSEASNLPRNA